MNWDAAKDVLMSSSLGNLVNFEDDRVVEDLLNAHGWEVLHTFQGV
jgi:hypothetical protein